MHYYSFNIADYRKDTQHLTPIEHYIYRELMDWYYLDETSIPRKTQLVLRRLRLVSENNQDLQNVLEEFFIEGEEGWSHGRIETEIAAYKAKADTARVNGSKGGRPKKPKKTQPVNLANPEKTGSKANHKPITNNQEPLKDSTPPAAPAFNFKKSLLDLGVDQQAVDTWLAVRKKKRAVNSELALKGLLREVEIAGITVNEAVNHSAKNSWSGFEAGWYKKGNSNATNQQKSDSIIEATFGASGEVF